MLRVRASEVQNARPGRKTFSRVTDTRKLPDPMYPVVFRIGTFEVTSFGVMIALAVLTGLAIFRSELNRSHLPLEGVDAALIGVMGGLLGAKLVWAVEFHQEGPFLSLLLSRGGLSWFGGFLGGVGSGLWALRRRRIPLIGALAAAAPALAFGHAIGRIGCFLVGDDYGRPTDLPWGVAFPCRRRRYPFTRRSYTNRPDSSLSGGC
jgi:phosphatidylglycerol---prolipoprotein diacylglyceryl transferase